MKKITYFSLPLCVFCVDASRWITEVMYEHPEYENIEFEMINAIRNKDLAKEYKLMSAPTFYLDKEAYHEGEASKEIVEQIFKAAYES